MIEPTRNRTGLDDTLPTHSLQLPNFPFSIFAAKRSTHPPDMQNADGILFVLIRFWALFAVFLVLILVDFKDSS